MYLAEISRHSISSPSAINLSRYSSKWSDHSSNKWNISFNFPKVKTGESLVLKGLHLSASSLKRCSDNGSTYKICVDILANLRNAFYRRTGELNWRKIFERLFTFLQPSFTAIFYATSLKYTSGNNVLKLKVINTAKPWNIEGSMNLYVLQVLNWVTG